MKRGILLLFTALFVVAVQIKCAQALPKEVEELLPSETDVVWEGVSLGDGVIALLSKGIGSLINKVCQSAKTMAKEAVAGAVMLLCAVLLCSLVEDTGLTAENSVVRRVIPLAGVVTVTMIAVGDVELLMGQGIQAVESMHMLSKTLLPTLLAAVAAGGGAISAGVRHVAAVFFADLLISVARDCLMPLVYVYVAVTAADVLLPERKLASVAEAVRKGTSWLLRGLLACYTGYLTLAGAVASASDSLAVQMTKAAAGVVPVVGSVISDAAATVLGGAGVLKNTLGVAGTIAVLTLCLTPFLRLALQFLLYKITAFLAGTIGAGGLMKLIDGLGGAFAMMLGITCACAVMLLISVVGAVMVVTQ